MSHHLPVYVASGCGIPLLGHDWFRRLGFAVVDATSRPIIDRSEPPAPISLIQSVRRRIADSYASQYECFPPGPGRYTGPPVSLLLDPSVPPVKLKPRPLPFAKRERVQRQIEAMDKDGILTKIRYSPWQTPLVAIEKKGGSFRLCADYRLTTNLAIILDQYPLPTLDELFAKIVLQTAFGVVLILRPPTLNGQWMIPVPLLRL